MPKLQYIRKAQTSPPASDGPFVGVHTSPLGFGDGQQIFIGTDSSIGTIEGRLQYTLPRGGTLKFGRLWVFASSLNGQMVAEIRINGVAVMSVTVPSGGTGKFQMSPSEVTVNEGDQISVRADTTAASSGSIVGVAVSYLIED